MSTEAPTPGEVRWRLDQIERDADALAAEVRAANAALDQANAKIAAARTALG
jgi:hypothetical protein